MPRRRYGSDSRRPPHPRRHRSSARTSAFQAEEAGSTPAAGSRVTRPARRRSSETVGPVPRLGRVSTDRRLHAGGASAPTRLVPRSARVSTGRRLQGPVAQLAEHSFETREVGSSDPPRAATVHHQTEQEETMVAVAQLVRAPGCGSGGRRFEPARSPSMRRRPMAGRPAVTRAIEVRPLSAQLVRSGVVQWQHTWPWTRRQGFDPSPRN